MNGIPLEGLYCAETQFLTFYRLTVNGRALMHRLSTQISANEWSSIGLAAKADEGPGNYPAGETPLGTLEARTLRKIEGGLKERLAFRNHGSRARTVRARIELACPIQDAEHNEEMKTERQEPVRGLKPRLARTRDGVLLRFERSFGLRRRTPTEELRRSRGESVPRDGQPVRRALEIRVRPVAGSCPIRVSVHAGRVTVIELRARLPGKAEAAVDFDYEPIIDGVRMRAPATPDIQPLPKAAVTVPEGFPVIQTGNSTLNLIIGQAMTDLGRLRLAPFGSGSDPSSRESDAFIAGVPRYIGIFSRDTLITAWQSALLGRDLVEPPLRRVAALRGVRFDAWRDEEPKRLPHERRLNPLSEIGRMNRSLYYGDVTATPFWVIALGALFGICGDIDILRAHQVALRDCLDWICWRLQKGNGFVYYAPALPGSNDANRNQAWKDSGDAIVDEEGRVCVPPLAVAEIQGYAYQALREGAAMLTFLGEEERSGELLRTAEALKTRFNREFWVPEERFFALALQDGRRKLRTRASNAGHCLGTGIVERDKVPDLVRGLMEADLFSGWGIRTLSERNPSFDPFSYHRGTVWPVENAIIAAGLMHQGWHEEAYRIIEGQLGVASAFHHMRLPEVMSGHARATDLPMPGLYPFANLLQAWSVSAIIQFVQAILGLYPFAQNGVLLVDPHLPKWLPWAEIHGLRIGGSELDLRFVRQEDGSSTWEVLRCTGEITVRRGERLKEWEKVAFPRKGRAA